MYKLIMTNLIQSEAAWRKQRHTFREGIMTIKTKTRSNVQYRCNLLLVCHDRFSAVTVGLNDSLTA